MAVKTFHEILNEKMGAKEPQTADSRRENFEIRPEFDLSLVQFTQTVFRPRAAYPKGEVKVAPPKAAPKPPPPVDKVIETELLSAAERLAIGALEIKEEAFLSRNEVKAKHRALVRKLHPDRHPAGLSDLERRLLSEKFQLVQESYELLEDAFRRHNPKQQ